MKYPTFEQIIDKVWPKNSARNVNVALDKHEQHFGLDMHEDDIMKGIGQ